MAPVPLKPSSAQLDPWPVCLRERERATRGARRGGTRYTDAAAASQGIKSQGGLRHRDAISQNPLGQRETPAFARNRRAED